MEWMSLNTVREKYLSFFESKGHLRLNSFPLVPQNDPSLLLINSGMAPMKKYFTGEVTPPCKRVTTCQKCIRTPDLDRVGHTARHGTYFEMLGNFSFGDYFKTEAIHWAWEFLTEWLQIPADLLWPSIYEDDEEAFHIWRDEIGVPAERIVRLGKADNFWEHGSGPCGPCSEIYFDRGEKYGCGSPDCKPGCDCDRYMEIWNNVFSQFNNDGHGNYTELKQKNIDTGMGLERLACVLQGVDNLFEVDTVRNILNTVCRIAGKTYGQNARDDISIRVITDHLRGATFMICDGVLPSNEGRGYVLRRLLRRAARHGKLLGIARAFLTEICDAVIAENKDAYPELLEKQALIKKIISVEESNFAKTIDQGLKLLDEMAAAAGAQLSGEDAFKLYDTYGFPLDITRDILEEKGMTVDEEAFNRLMQEQRQRARSARKSADAEAWKGDGALFAGIPSTAFTGYTQESGKASVLALVKDGERTEAAGMGDAVLLVLDNTPFYAESGGQIGDAGTIESENALLKVTDTQKTPGGVYTHACTVEKGIVSVGDAVTAQIDVQRRTAIRRNHTAAHLLQAALRAVLGTHVEQAGQLVTEQLLRFDFTHFSALSAQELTTVESWVNAALLGGIAVQNQEMPIAEAKAMGAMALFGEKYGDVVRVVSVPGCSVELCGGTHIDNTAKIGLFKILSEASVAAGVRRIEAVTGAGVLDYIARQNQEILGACEALKINNPADLTRRCAQLAEELKEKTHAIDALNTRMANAKIEELLAAAEPVGSLRLITAKVKDMSGDALRSMGDSLKAAGADIVAVIANVGGSGVSFAAAAGTAAVAAGVMAGKLVGAVSAVAGGKGGGRPDFAMAGAKDPAKVDAALAAAKPFVLENLK